MSANLLTVNVDTVCRNEYENRFPCVEITGTSRPNEALVSNHFPKPALTIVPNLVLNAVTKPLVSNLQKPEGGTSGLPEFPELPGAHLGSQQSSGILPITATDRRKLLLDAYPV